VSDHQWQGRGPDFSLEWGGRIWSLDLRAAKPGLRLTGKQPGESTELLCLDGLAQVGRSDPNAFNPATLVHFERHRSRIESVFAPPGWGGSRIRAAWSPMPDSDGVDFEVQINATSVDELRALEVGVLSDCRESLEDRSLEMEYRIEPRDAPSAASSYDGREPLTLLRALTTGPLPSSSPSILRPWVRLVPGASSDRFYVEMAHRNDVARRLIASPAGTERSYQADAAVRYALFGHDLEKGVILRARMRGLWIQSNSPEGDALTLLQEFIDEPPPLGP
jgi:hypothetical protein